MNKKAIIGSIVGLVVIIMLCFVGCIIYQEYIEHKSYRDFCNERPSFCYCSSVLSCEFRIDEDLFNKEIQELCELATERNDRKIMFKARCIK